MTYNEQIKALIDEVRPQFGLLGMYAFRGEGNPEAVTNAFVQVAEAYLKAKQLTQDTFGSDSLKVAPGSTLCAPEENNSNDDALLNAYEFAKTAGFLPPPLFAQIGDFTMQMNRFFIAAQQKEDK